MSTTTEIIEQTTNPFDESKKYTITLGSDSRDDNYYDKAELFIETGVHLGTSDGDVCYFTGAELNKLPKKDLLVAALKNGNSGIKFGYYTARLYVINDFDV